MAMAQDRAATQDTTARVVAIATEVFGRPARPTDSYFDLGGDSLLAVVFALRLEEGFGADVDPTTLLEGASLESIAATLAGAGRP